MSRIWAGIDCGKTHHHCAGRWMPRGNTLLSRRVANDEPELLRGVESCTWHSVDSYETYSASYEVGRSQRFRTFTQETLNVTIPGER